MRNRTPDENGTLLCIDCDTRKDADEFYLTGRTRGGVPTRFSYCKSCKSARDKSLRAGLPVPDHKVKSKAGATEIHCPVCDTTKPSSEFSFRSTGRQKGQPYLPCKACKNARLREYKRNNPERFKRYNQPAHLRAHYTKQYGLTPDDVRRMIEEQGGECPVCHTAIVGDGARTPAIDHCHDTGVVRGILCKQCNSGLGLLGDTAARLTSALEYLTRS